MDNFFLYLSAQKIRYTAGSVIRSEVDVGCYIAVVKGWSKLTHAIGMRTCKEGIFCCGRPKGEVKCRHWNRRVIQVEADIQCLQKLICLGACQLQI